MVIEDPRTKFFIPEDRQVIAYFEWEGPRGTHHFEGIWKNPQGKPTVFSDFAYDAREVRFGAYWKLILSEDTQPGLWTLEARVDAELAGTQTVEVVAAPRPNITVATARVLSPADIYKQAQAATVTLEKLGSSGERLATSSGFFVDDGLVLTAFQSIDGAISLRLILPGGQRLETSEVMAWNRWQDWALLKVAATNVGKLPRARPNSWAIGDRCFYLDFQSEGNRVIVDTNIVGQSEFPRAGQRLSVANGQSPRSTGSALLNEYGEAIAVLGGSTVPGASSLEGTSQGYAQNLIAQPFLRGQMAVPISLIPAPPGNTATTTLSELARRGQFLPPVRFNENIAYGTLARDLLPRGPLTEAVNAKFEFNRRDTEAAALIVWTPKEKLKGLALLRVYDLDNHLMKESKSIKFDFRPQQTATMGWKFGIAGLLPGVYRIDVLIGNDVVWRSFFRIQE